MAWGNPAGFKSCDAILGRIESNDSQLIELVILPMKNFGSDEVDRLAAAIASGTNTTLQTITASGHAITPASCTVLGSAIATAFRRSDVKVALKEVAIGDEMMGDDGVSCFCNPLVEVVGGGLESVDFSLKGITKDGTKAISCAFKRSTILRRLLLYRNSTIGDEGIAALFHNNDDAATAFFPSLEYLDLSECGIGGDGVQSLVNGLLSGGEEEKEGGGGGASVRRKAILDLTLDQNAIGEDAGKHLTRIIFTSCGNGDCGSSSNSGGLPSMLPSHQPSASILRCLKLRNCAIGDAGLRALLRSTTTTTTTSTNNPLDGNKIMSHLEVLDLTGNNITGSGSLGDSSVTNALASLTNLSELTLANNPDIGPKGIVALKASFAGRCLRCLDLTNTRCGVDGALAFLSRSTSDDDDCGVGGVGGVVTIESFRLFDNHLGSEGFEAIANSWMATVAGDDCSVEKSSSSLPPIGDLDLGGNRAGSKAVVSLLRAVLVASEDENLNNQRGERDDDVGLRLRTLEIGGNDSVGEDVETVIEKLGEVRPDLDVVRDKKASSGSDD